MPTKNKTILVVGAGASADFRKKNDSDKIAEIYRTENQISGDPMQIIKKPKGDYFAMPTGQELINQMIGFGVEVLKFGLRSYIFKKLEGKNFRHRTPEEVANHVHLQFKNSLKNKPTNKILVETFNINQINETQRHLDSYGGNEISNELKEVIKHNLQLKDFAKIMADNSPLKNHLRLADLLNFYDPESIDNFLSSIENGLIDINPDQSKEKFSKEELIKAGKELITYFLIKAEDKDIFSADNFIWYRWLREAIINGYDDSKIENLEIINFNYDRSLAYYLNSKMPNFSEKIKAKITYPYGSLSEAEIGFEYGKLKEDQKSNDFCIFKFFEDDNFRKMAEKIFVIGEERKEMEKKLENFKNEIIRNQTKRIYFLGFGFIAQNCKLFLNRGYTSAEEFYYTNFDNSQKIKRAFEYEFDGGTHFHNHATSHRGVYEAIQKDFELKID